MSDEKQYTNLPRSKGFLFTTGKLYSHSAHLENFQKALDQGDLAQIKIMYEQIRHTILFIKIDKLQFATMLRIATAKKDIPLIMKMKEDATDNIDHLEAVLKKLIEEAAESFLSAVVRKDSSAAISLLKKHAWLFKKSQELCNDDPYFKRDLDKLLYLAIIAREESVILNLLLIGADPFKKAGGYILLHHIDQQFAGCPAFKQGVLANILQNFNPKEFNKVSFLLIYAKKWKSPHTLITTLNLEYDRLKESKAKLKLPAPMRPHDGKMSLKKYLGPNPNKSEHKKTRKEAKQTLISENRLSFLRALHQLPEKREERARKALEAGIRKLEELEGKNKKPFRWRY